MKPRTFLITINRKDGFFKRWFNRYSIEITDGKHTYKLGAVGSFQIMTDKPLKEPVIEDARITL